VRTAIRKHLGDFLAIAGLALVAAVVSVYILDHQRMRFPFFEDKPFRLNAEFQTAQAVTAGQGQTVRVSGVRVGDIAGVDLKDGRAIVRLDIDRKYEHLVRTNATALLRPKTGLKDMFVELDPGRAPARVAKQGYTIPVNNTLPDVNPDEVLAVLDGDTRQYLQLLVQGAGQGLKGRGGDLNDVLRRFEPTHRDLAAVSSAVATRRKNLSRLITNLHELSGALGEKDGELAQLVDSSSAVFRSFASEQQNLSRAVAAFPSALRQTTDTLGKVQTLSETLAPAADHLRPAVRAIDDANKAVKPFVTEAAPLLRKDIRPFVREARPLARELKPASDRLAQATPDLTRSFGVLNHLFNMLGYNPNGREAPSVTNGLREEGYLFWLAWISHQSLNLFSTGDANGTFRPLTIGSPCNVIKATVQDNPETEFLQGLTGVLTDPRLCG
jgi:phospholipid/cholesterol/gamma-HCH transport system substrate-binding protein